MPVCGQDRVNIQSRKAKSEFLEISSPNQMELLGFGFCIPGLYIYKERIEPSSCKNISQNYFDNYYKEIIELYYDENILPL